MNILITGGAGFIGSNLAAYHVNKGDNVTVIDDLSTGRLENIKIVLNQPNFKFYQHNLVTWDGLTEVLPLVDRIYHLAAVVGMFNVIKHPIETLNVNVNGTIHLFEAIQDLGIKPLILVASSSEVYGDQHRDLVEDQPLMLEGSLTSHAAYPISKLGQESIAMGFWHKHQIPSVVLRLFNTIGNDQLSSYGMVIPRFIRQALQNEEITVFGDGEQKRSFCDIRDTVNLINLLAENPASVGEIVNVGNNKEISINELAKLIKHASKSQSSIVHIPFEIAYHNDSILISERKPSLDKLISLTSYRFQWDLERTISDIILSKKSI